VPLHFREIKLDGQSEVLELHVPANQSKMTLRKN